MISFGELIWVSAQPVIRLFLCVAAGCIITKAGFFPPVAAGGVGKIILNVTLPSLMFSRIVPAFNYSNVGALGPLVFVALLYEVIGMTMSWMIKQLFWVPHRFRYGILVAGGWANVGDVPTSVILSLTAAAPFNGASDQNLAVAYISVFLLIFMMTLFPLGFVNWVMIDFEGPDVTDEDVQERLRTKQKHIFSAIERIVVSLRQRKAQVKNSDYGSEKSSTHQLPDPPSPSLSSRKDPQMAVQEASELPETTGEPAIPLFHRLARFGWVVFQAFISPCSLSIIMGFIISIVPVLKALFVPDVPGVKMPSAPDGQHPLAIILHTTTFIGDASVPLGLMTLGSTLARMEIPGGRLRNLPLGVIGALTIARMVIMPILGVLITQGLTQVGILDARDKVLQFVCIFLSCLPTATTQVFLTQVYSGTGNAQHLSVFLVPQYMLMPVMMTALTAFALHFLFS